MKTAAPSHLASSCPTKLVKLHTTKVDNDKRVRWIVHEPEKRRQKNDWNELNWTFFSCNMQPSVMLVSIFIHRKKKKKNLRIALQYLFFLKYKTHAAVDHRCMDDWRHSDIVPQKAIKRGISFLKSGNFSGDLDSTRRKGAGGPTGHKLLIRQIIFHPKWRGEGGVGRKWEWNNGLCPCMTWGVTGPAHRAY